MKKIKFMNLPDEFSLLDNSKVVIIPIVNKAKLSHGKNSLKGPKAIIKASYELEYYDTELEVEPYEQNIYLNKINILRKNRFEITTKQIKKIVSKFINKFPIVIGGDHSISLGVVKSMEENYKDFGIITFDAHSDLREPWGKNTWWHACVSRLISNNHKELIVGVRSMDYYESEFVKSKDSNVYILKTKDILDYKNNSYDLKKCSSFDNMLRKLPKNIYISIDVDVFDPSIIKNVNTPEPNGLNWSQLNNLLKKIFKHKNVIGADITEFSPKGKEIDYFSESFTLAKLVYKLIAYKFYKKKL